MKPVVPAPSVLRNVTWTSMGQGAGFALNFASSIILARWLGPEGRGIYAIVITTASLLAIGAGNNAVFSAYTYLAGKGRFQASKIGGMVLWTSLIPALVLLCLFTVLPGHIMGRFLPGVPASRAWLVVLWTLQLLINGQVAGLLAGRDEIRWVVLLSVAGSTVDLLLQIIYLVVLDRGLAGAFRLLLLSATIKGGLALVVLTLRAGISVRPDGGLLRETISFSSKYYPGSVSKVLMVRADLYVVGLLVGPTAAGYYAVARGVASMVSFIEAPIRQAVLPKIVARDFGRSISLVNRAFHSGFWLTALVAALGAAVSPWLIPALYGAAFTSSVPVFVLLLPGMLFLVTLTIEPFFSMQLGRPEITTVIVVLSALVSLPMIYFFTRRFGTVGTAVASSLGTTARGVAIIVVYLRISGQSVRALFVPERAVVGRVVRMFE